MRCCAPAQPEPHHSRTGEDRCTCLQQLELGGWAAGLGAGGLGACQPLSACPFRHRGGVQSTYRAHRAWLDEVSAAQQPPPHASPGGRTAVARRTAAALATTSAIVESRACRPARAPCLRSIAKRRGRPTIKLPTQKIYYPVTGNLPIQGSARRNVAVAAGAGGQRACTP